LRNRGRRVDSRRSPLLFRFSRKAALSVHDT
jgi:hypothetical protein